MTQSVVQNALPGELDRLRPHLAPPNEVMRPERMGAAWPTRHSFARTLTRHMFRHGWRVQTVRLELDRFGCGEAIYQIHTQGEPLYFVVFSTTIDESQRLDRVIAESWDVTAALCQGELTESRLALLRREVPRQEQGHVDADTLVLTRANRSARFFDAAVDALSRGHQIDLRETGPAGYLLRSTAFYGNGKFGTLPFAALTPAHPVGVSYRAQMLAAWLLREFSLDLAESCAARRRASATTMTAAQRRNLGIGNATGLGMVPFFAKHPHIINAWTSIRELSLAAALQAAPPDAGRLARLAALLRRAEGHFRERRGLVRAPFTAAQQLEQECAAMAGELARLGPVISRSAGWRALYEWACGTVSDEAVELLRSQLAELDAGLDDPLEALTAVTESFDTQPAMPVSALREVLARDYGWTREWDFAQPDAQHYFWYASENNEEPRRGVRGVDDGETREQPFDVARQVHGLERALSDLPASASTARVLVREPGLRGIVARVQSLQGVPYGEVRANLLDRSFLPLTLQKFKLSMYGMQNHAPKSTDWLRVTLFQGAPTARDLDGGAEGDWMFPVMEGGV